MANNAIGTVDTPDHLSNFLAVEEGGIGQLLSIFATSLIAIAGIYALFNFILAGYAFLSADNDPAKLQGAWAKIYQSIIGLAIAMAAFSIAGIVGTILFDSPSALLSPTIPLPN